MRSAAQKRQVSGCANMRTLESSAQSAGHLHVPYKNRINIKGAPVCRTTRSMCKLRAGSPRMRNLYPDFKPRYLTSPRDKGHIRKTNTQNMDEPPRSTLTLPAMPEWNGKLTLCRRQFVGPGIGIPVMHDTCLRC